MNIDWKTSPYPLGTAVVMLIVRYQNSTSAMARYIRNSLYSNIVREPGRFDVIVTIAVAILAAIGFMHIIENKDDRKKMLYAAILSVIILAEYVGFATPPFSSQLYMNSTIPAEYYAIGNVSGNFSVLMLPSLPQAGSKPAEFTGLETYYITATKKPLIGGYTGRTNNTQELSVALIPLSEQAQTLPIA